MPELPEVQALADFLHERLHGRTVTGVHVPGPAALKTVVPGPQDLVGRPVAAVGRHGKWLDVATDGPHLLVHLSRAGWVRWHDDAPATPPRPGRGPVQVRVTSDPGAFDITEAGTRKRVAVHVVTDPQEVPAVADLGVDPLSEEFTAARLGDLARVRSQQVKGLLRDQRSLAGVGNAYSDEILHSARMSPYTLTSALSDDDVGLLHEVTVRVLREAVAAASGRPATELKDAKRRGMRVHGRSGLPCPVCGDTVREVSFADRSMQYCPTCQTGGKVLADRRMSRLLR